MDLSKLQIVKEDKIIKIFYDKKPFIIKHSNKFNSYLNDILEENGTSVEDVDKRLIELINTP